MRVLSEREWSMLEALWHLRYLATGQLHEGWYEERTLGCCQTRLSRLGKAGVLERVRLQDTHWAGTWRLGRLGLRMLAERLGEDLQPYQRLTSLFLPHLLETNEVLLALAPRGWTWSTLPFVWSGSHRCGLSFKEAKRYGTTGVQRRRRRMLRPDAIILPRSATSSCGGDSKTVSDRKGPRVFLELDRATESVVSGTGRTSIESKLKAYRTFLFGRADETGTWYEHAFGDRLWPAIVFVVPASPGQSRRQESIRSVASQADPAVARLVHCCPANDLSWLRASMCGPSAPTAGDDRRGSRGPGAERWPGGRDRHCTARHGCCGGRPSESGLTLEEVSQLQEFFRVSVEAYRRLHPGSSVRPRFKAAAAQARKALERFPSAPCQRSAAEQGEQGSDPGSLGRGAPAAGSQRG